MFLLNDLVVKSVDVLGGLVTAVKDDENTIWVGINYFCQGLDMNKKQRDYQVEKIKADKTLKRGSRKFPAGIFDASHEMYALRLDFIPMWLSKITITDKMEQDHPDLADKLLNYQLKAKDILAAAFLPKEKQMPKTTDDKIALLAQGHTELRAEVDEIKAEVKALKDDMPVFQMDTKDIQDALKKKAIETLGGKESNAYHDNSIRGYAFADIQIELRRQFGVKRYDQIKHKDVPIALNIIEEYKPPIHIRDKIQNANAQQRLDV